MKLNLGCGWDHREGWVNVDFLEEHKPDVIADVLELPFPEGSAAEILAQDVLEHLPRTNTRTALDEWFRVLEENGSIEVRVPSLFNAVSLMQLNQFFNFHETLIQNLYGTQAYTGDVHLTSFTDITLSKYFYEAGFRSVTIEIRDAWMFLIRASKSIGSGVTTIFSTGIYGAENLNDNFWNWCAPHETLKFINETETTKNVTISLKPCNPIDNKAIFSMTRDGITDSYKMNQNLIKTYSVEPGLTTIFLDTDGDIVPEPSTRKLACQLHNLKVKIH
jgi:hypothetical protein